MSHEIRLSTMGRCFLCLQPSTHTWGEGDDPERHLFPLQSLCRHLEISLDKVIKSTPGGSSEGQGVTSSVVPLCGRCGRSYVKFMDFFHTRELIDMELEHLLRSMKGWMVGTAETVLKGCKSRRLMGVQSREWEQLKIVEELREKIIVKSALKLLQTKPIVKLDKLELERGSLSQDTLISTTLPPEPAPPSLEDSTKFIEKHDQYDDDDDDIPVPILEIVKLEPPDDVRTEPRQYDGVDGEVMIELNTDTHGQESSGPSPDAIEFKVKPDLHGERDNDDTDPLWDPEIPPNNLNSDNEDDEDWKPKEARGSTKPRRAPRRHFPVIRKSGRAWKCKLCPKQYSCKAGWRIHYDSAHLGKRYTCDICSSSFTQLTTMTKHRKLCKGRRRTPSPVPVASGSGVILKEKPRSDSGPIGVFSKHYFQNEAGKYVCSLCQKEYVNNSGFYAHFRSTHIKMRWQCTDCRKTFTQNCTLTKHKETCSGKRRPAPELKYCCKFCGKGLATLGWLKEHEERVHLGIKHTCDVCMKSYAYKHCLHRHACTGPPTTSSNKANSNSTTVNVNRFTCKFCGTEFPSYIHFRAHCRNKHMKVHQRCPVCLTTFSRDCGLQLHKKGKCEGEPIPLDPEKANPFECLECGNKFTTRAGLVIHRESVHQGAVYRCRLCNKPFTNMSNVRRHQRACLSRPSSKIGIAPLHPDQEPFKPRRVMRKADGTYECEQCQEKFKTAPQLTFHMRTVHLGLTFECGKCKKTFSRRGGLQLHQRRHCPASTPIPGGPQLKTDNESSSSKGKCDDIEEPTGSYAFYCSKGKRIGEVICNLCKRSFSSKIGFRIHYQSIHQGIPHQYRCQICSNTFPKKADLVEHKREDKCSGTVPKLEDDDNKG